MESLFLFNFAHVPMGTSKVKCSPHTGPYQGPVEELLSKVREQADRSVI